MAWIRAIRCRIRDVEHCNLGDVSLAGGPVTCNICRDDDAYISCERGWRFARSTVSIQTLMLRDGWQWWFGARPVRSARPGRRRARYQGERPAAFTSARTGSVAATAIRRRLLPRPGAAASRCQCRPVPENRAPGWSPASAGSRPSACTWLPLAPERTDAARPRSARARTSRLPSRRSLSRRFASSMLSSCWNARSTACRPRNA